MSPAKLITAILCFTAAASAQPDAPKAHWTFNEIVSGSFQCTPLTKARAQIVKTKKWKNPPQPKLENGIKDKAFECGGAPSDQFGYFARVDNPPTLEGPFTIAMWIRPREGGQWSTRVLYYKPNWLSHRGLELKLSSTKLGLVNGKRGGKKKDLRYLASDIPFQTGHWSFITITWDTHGWKLYYNGRQVGKDYSRTYRYRPPGQNVPMKFGGYTIHTNNVYQGLIDDVRIWNRPLSQKEIVEIMLQDIR